jgi:hypothetical protein
MPSLAYTKRVDQTAYLDTQTITIGTYENDGPIMTYSYYGMGTTGRPSAFGSMSDGTSNLYSGASILALYYLNVYDKNNMEVASTQVQLIINGTVSNSGWTTMTIGTAETYQRADAVFTTPSGRSEWVWDMVESSELASGIKMVRWS